MIKLAIKDLRLFLKDRRSMLVTFVIPIALITLFAFTFGGAGNNDNDTKISLLISDLDHTAPSKAAIKEFDSLKSLSIKITSLAEAEKSIKKGSKSCVMIIHEGFSDSLKAGKKLPLELKYDEAKKIEVGLLQQSIIPTIAMLPFKLGNTRVSMANRLIRISGTSNPQAKQTIRSHSNNLFDAMGNEISENKSKKKTSPNSNFMGGDIKMTKLVKAKNGSQLGLIHAVAGTAVMMLLFSVVGIGMGLLDEKQEGTLKRLMYCPMNPTNILFSKMISANIVSVLQLLIMFLFANLAFGLAVFSHLAGLLITIIATAFACSSFGVLLASFAKNRQEVQGLSLLIILVMSAIGDSMIPLFIMPTIIRKAAIISVNYWSIQGFYDVFWRKLSITNPTFISRILILFLIGIVLNTLAIFMFKKNIMKLT